MKGRFVRVLLGIVPVFCVGVVSAWASDADVNARLAELERQLKQARAEIQQLRAQSSQQYLDQRRTEQLKQLIKEVLADTEVRSQMLGSVLNAGYDGKHFFIASEDDSFRLNFNAIFQFRWSQLMVDEKDADRWGVDASADNFEVERGYIGLNGHVMDKLGYDILLSFDSDSRDGGSVYRWYFKYPFREEIGVKFGQFSLPFGRQEQTSCAAQMFVDRSLANELFNLDRSPGISLYGSLFDKKLHYEVGIFNDFDADTRSPFIQEDNSPAVAARLVWTVLGSPSDFANESDLQCHENWVLQLGLSLAYEDANNENHFIGGNNDSYEVVLGAVDGSVCPYEAYGDIFMLGLDAAAKYRGLAMSAEFWGQFLNLKGTGQEGDFPGELPPDPDALDGQNFGLLVQAGYFLIKNKLELVGRYDLICPDQADHHIDELACGLNYYINGQNLKLSLDYTYVDFLPVAYESTANYYGVRDHELHMIRAQVQVKF